MTSTRELEFLLYEHSAVWDVVIVEDQDASLAIFVKLRPGKRIEAGELALFCKQKLTETVKRFYVVDQLPKTKTGKFARHQLMQLVTNGAAAYNF